MPRGKKSCPECHALVGPRLAVCECGYKFAFKQGKAPKRKREALPLPPGKKPFEALTENPSEVVGISDREALKSFIRQLESCYTDSNRNAGCYSAFLHHKHGTLQVEVALEMRLK
jgi:hypothetical protein